MGLPALLGHMESVPAWHTWGGSLNEACHVPFSYNSTVEDPAVSSSSSMAAEVQRKSKWGERKQEYVSESLSRRRKGSSWP